MKKKTLIKLSKVYLRQVSRQVDQTFFVSSYFIYPYKN